MATISKATVIKIKEYGTDVREYILKPEKYNFFDAGTFLQLALEEPQNNRWPESRNFSLASNFSDDKTIRLVIRRIGSFTSRIFEELKVGAHCYLKYSFGDFLLPFYDSLNPIVCIAGGTGVAPFISFAGQLSKDEQIDRMHLYYSAKTQEELVCFEELSKLLPKQNCNISLTREDNPNFEKGRISLDKIKSEIPNIEEAHFYICGGEEFTAHFKNGLIAEGAKIIYTDEW